MFMFSRVQRVSEIAAIAGFHSHVPLESHPSQHLETVWFIKVLCTLCVRTSPSLQIFKSQYFEKNLNPFLAFEVIKHVNFSFRNPKLAFGFFQFTRTNLKIVHSFDTYYMLLRSFSELGFHDLARDVLDCMRLDGYLLDNALFEFLVMSFANAGKFDVAKELFIAQELLILRSGSDRVGRISSFVYNNFLSLLVRKNQVNEAVGFFRDHILRSKCFYPDTCTFNIVLRGMCKVGEPDKAFVLLNDMNSFGCLPDVVSYNILINGFCRIGNVVRAYELLREIQSQDQFPPDIVSYTSVISGYCRQGEMDKASNLFDQMISRGIKPNLVTFNAVIDGFGKTGDMTSALSMYARMLYLGCPPDVVTFTSLIDGHCRMGQVDHGLKLWNEIHTRKLHPNVYTFSVIINGLCKQNRLNEARDFLKQLNCRGDIAPQPFLYNPVIDGFCKSGNVDEANVILAEMEEKKCKPDKLTFTILIIGHCMKGRMFEAINMFNKMLAVGCSPDKITIKSLISCLQKAGMPKEAHKIRLAVAGYLDSSLPSSTRRIPDANINVAVK
ncbi:Pentatricopeptide repeat-containing protein [Heracleum sosnowskyi]|uniref:Pentatricopeptide repeat-containing protein n=1 Tax=Heracleum sosnowskyi TaxID=360622 RepID=A0AAD8JEK3_9APIA|nr:Pentatricopeptide repeat-containing protein [Heracleum sosnowskyi]